MCLIAEHFNWKILLYQGEEDLPRRVKSEKLFKLTPQVRQIFVCPSEALSDVKLQAASPRQHGWIDVRPGALVESENEVVPKGHRAIFEPK